MRIDLALKYLCLAKSRSAVKTMCDSNAVTVNERPAKPSSVLHVDDEVRITTPAWTLTISLLAIPEKQLSKTAAPAYYRVVERTRTDPDG
jgi:ribosomal 50S subunit-recycling heat shock protein